MDISEAPSVSQPRWIEPGIRAYPPTQTMTFMRCPRRWALEQAGWRAREGWKPNMLAGQAIHAGAWALDDPEVNPEDIAREVLVSGWPSDTTEHDLEGTWAGVKRGLKALGKIALIPDGAWSLTEVCLDHVTCLDHIASRWVYSPEHVSTPGQCPMADLIYRDEEGQVTLVDLKTRLVGGDTVAQSEYRIRKALDELPHDWQLLDYAWRWWQNTGTIPGSIRKIIVSCSPVLVREAEIPVSEPMLRQWERAAIEWWAGMAGVERWGGCPTLAAPNYTSCEDFGGCPYKLLCHDLFGDLNKAGDFYDRRVG